MNAASSSRRKTVRSKADSFQGRNSVALCHTTMLPLVVAITLCALIAFLYVGSLYIWNAILGEPPPDQLLGRNTPAVVWRRFAGVGLACPLAVAIIHLVRASGRLATTNEDPPSLAATLGLHLHHLPQAVGYPLALTALLYTGPLLMSLSDTCHRPAKSPGSPPRTSLTAGIITALSDVCTWRNLVTAPVTEELVFRACMCPLLLCGGLSPTAVVFTCPLFFGAAHLHHFFDLLRNERYSISMAACITCLQFSYTTIFGWFAAFLFLRTGHVAGPVAAHVFCNVMGLPDFGAIPGHPHRIVVSLAFVVGVVAFSKALGPMTRPVFYWDSPLVPQSGVCSCSLGYCQWR